MADYIYLGARSTYLASGTRYKFRFKFDGYSVDDIKAQTVRISVNKKTLVTDGSHFDLHVGRFTGRITPESGFGTLENMLALRRHEGPLRLWLYDSTGVGDYIDVIWSGNKSPRKPFRCIGDIWIVGFQFQEYLE